VRGTSDIREHSAGPGISRPADTMCPQDSEILLLEGKDSTCG